MNDKDFLAHVGVLGMKWGKRKAKSGPSSDDYTKARQLRAKGSKNLSTAELKDLTARLQLEKQYKELSPSKVKKGMGIVKAITAAGTTMASVYALSKTPLGQDIQKAVTMAFGKAQAAEKVKWVL